MDKDRRTNHAIHFYINEISAKIVAESGRPEDRYHLGKLVLRGLKEDPDFVLQIDGATGKSETNSSVLNRSIRCATAFRSLGLQQKDVIILMGPNHLELAIPMYAALYLGVTIAPIDGALGVKELARLFTTDEPKIIVCQSKRAEDVANALQIAKLNSQIVTFDEKTETKEDVLSLRKLLDMGECEIEKFKASNFNPEVTPAFIICTSGTTGLPKQAVHTHKSYFIGAFSVWDKETTFPTPTRACLILSPIQWTTAIMQFICSAILKYTRLQSSFLMTPKHARHLINTYKPSQVIINPSFLTSLMLADDKDDEKCDFTCFDTIFIGGTTPSAELLVTIKDLSPKADIVNAYGISEAGFVFWDQKRNLYAQYKIVNPETHEEITQPNVTGELWLNGPVIFKGYYNNPEATEQALTPDGWFRTGDLFYRDEQWTYFFVDRLKLLLKYRNHQVSPAEIVEVIGQHPGVLDVAVTGVPDRECGDLPAACVVRRAGTTVTAQEIKDLVKDSLTDTKQLRGGVVFVDKIPTNVNGKVNQNKLKEIVLQAERE